VLGADLAALKAWLEQHSKTVLKGTDLATAINYPLSRWEELTRFLDYGYASSSNQLAICANLENVQEQKRYFNGGWNRPFCA
jgi:hypothetical protein